LQLPSPFASFCFQSFSAKCTSSFPNFGSDPGASMVHCINSFLAQINVWKSVSASMEILGALNLPLLYTEITMWKVEQHTFLPCYYTSANCSQVYGTYCNRSNIITLVPALLYSYHKIVTALYVQVKFSKIIHVSFQKMRLPCAGALRCWHELNSGACHVYVYYTGASCCYSQVMSEWHFLYLHHWGVYYVRYTNYS